MAYPAIEKMREYNSRRFGRDAGPLAPSLSEAEKEGLDLRSAALRFLFERCEGLGYDQKIEEEEVKTGKYFGTSLAPNQIPYNMQMDLNRLCFMRELEHFMDSGATEDAYNVYYCFLEIFSAGFAGSRRMAEMLSEYEANGSSLLMDHRDHYSHSVYVFILGLAIYETNRAFQGAFQDFYGFSSERSHEAACFFLEFWGWTSLFHDIGYPFELVFEQVLSCFEPDDEDRCGHNPYIIYRNTESLTKLGDAEQKRFEKLYGRSFQSLDEVLAYDITNKLGKDYGFTGKSLLQVLKNKPVSPESFCGYMDHAYFSALRLYRALAEAMRMEEESGDEAFLAAHVDALSAIALHYDLFTYSIEQTEAGGGRPLPMESHPLAWLLMLTDELQCWDRTSYGRNSRSRLYPMAVEFDFSGDRILARYQYDEAEQGKIDEYLWAYVNWKKEGKQGKAPRLKAYSDMADEKKSFLKNIESIVDLGKIPVTIVCDTAPVDRKNKQAYLSDSSFMHMHDLAVALSDGASAFDALSLEYKLYNIHRVRNFSRYLNQIRCFYTDRPVDFDMVTEFTKEQLDVLAPMEHERWVREHREMGWSPGKLYEEEKVPEGADEVSYRAMLREQLRCHKNAMDGGLTRERIREHYEALSEEEKEKDRHFFNRMLKLIRTLDGLRVYQL